MRPAKSVAHRICVIKQRRTLLLLVAAAVAPALLYLIYVLHYSVNVPWSVDDWSIVYLVHGVLHGRQPLSTVWDQYGDRRLVVGRVIFLAFGALDHLNERAVIGFAALIWIASFVMVLLLLKRYLDRRLSPVIVIFVALVWFSLDQPLNALWSFQLSWYLVTFFLLCMLCALCVPKKAGFGWLAVAALAAVAGSLSDVQGLLLWLVGALCIAWRYRARILQLTLWLVAAATTLAIYFVGYSFANSQCTPSYRCSVRYEVNHPILMAKCFLLLLGEVFPTYGSAVLGAHEALGAVLLGAGASVVAQALRARRTADSRIPLPVALIVFGTLFDLLIIESRSGEGLAHMASDQYVMANLLVLLGVVAFLVPHVRPSTAPSLRLRYFALGTLSALVAGQLATSLDFGLASASARVLTLNTEARVITNERSIPNSDWPCYAASTAFLWMPASIAVYVDGQALLDAKRDHLSLFSDEQLVHTYRAEGPPMLAACAQSVHGAAIPFASPNGDLAVR